MALFATVALLHAAASYPSSVKSFSTRTAGQTIASSWFNDLQDEVTAIEGGLLNGFQHALKPSSSAGQTLGTSGLPWGSPLYMTATSGGVLYGSAANTVQSSGTLTQYGVLYGGGAGAAPGVVAACSNNQVIAGVTSAAPTCRALTLADLPVLSARTTAAVNATTNTFADLSDLTVTVAASTNYVYRAFIEVSPADVTGGVKFGLAGTATLNNIQLFAELSNANTFSNTQATFWSNTTLTSNTTSNAGQSAYLLIVDGAISVNASGTVKLQFAQSAASGTSTVARNSYVTLVPTSN